MLTKTVVILLVSNIFYIQCLPQIQRYSDINQNHTNVQHVEEQNIQTKKETVATSEQLSQTSALNNWGGVQTGHQVQAPSHHQNDVTPNTASKVANLLYNQDNLKQTQQNHAQNNQFLEHETVQTNQALTKSNDVSQSTVFESDVLDNHDDQKNWDTIANQQYYGDHHAANSVLDQSTTLQKTGASTSETNLAQTGYQGVHQSQSTQNVVKNVKNVHSQQNSASHNTWSGIKTSGHHQNTGILHHGRQNQNYLTAKQAATENAKYHFAYQIDDNIEGSYNEREEHRENGKVTGFYKYDDGNVLRKVTYEADENGFRIISDEVQPSQKIETSPNGVATVKVYTDGTLTQYKITGDQIASTRKSAKLRGDDQEVLYY